METVIKLTQKNYITGNAGNPSGCFVLMIKEDKQWRKKKKRRCRSSLLNSWIPGNAPIWWKRWMKSAIWIYWITFWPTSGGSGSFWSGKAPGLSGETGRKRRSLRNWQAVWRGSKRYWKQKPINRKRMRRRGRFAWNSSSGAMKKEFALTISAAALISARRI